MLTRSNLLSLPWTPDLTAAGITVVCRWLAQGHAGLQRIPPDLLQRRIAAAGVDLAFRRFLSQHQVPFQVQANEVFTDPDHYDLSLGGHRCRVYSYLLTNQSQVKAIRDDPASLLKAQALIPTDQFYAERSRSSDIYLFAFLLAGSVVDRMSMNGISAGRQPGHPLALLPSDWARPRSWLPLQPLTIKSECNRMVSMEFGGLDADRSLLISRVDLAPRRPFLLTGDFYSLAYVHIQPPPEARIGIHSPIHSKVHIFQPHDWINLWLEGVDIHLTGWMTHEQFRGKASILPSGSRTFQFNRTRTRNLAVSVQNLTPLDDLLDHVQASDQAIGRKQP